MDRNVMIDKILDRGHVLHNGQKIKFLSVSLYEPCYYGGFPRDFIFRLPDNDGRRTRYFDGAQWSHEWYNNLPVGIWCEIVSPGKGGLNG